VVQVLDPKDLPHYTYADYARWEGRWELLDGIPFAMSPAPSIIHQRISQRIARVLDEALEDCDPCEALLPVDWKIADDTVVQPDNLVVCYTPSGNYLTRAPSLIFEVLSPATRHKDEKIKFRLYEAEGVHYYCLVDPEERLIKIYELEAGRYIKRADAVTEAVRFDLPDCRFELDCSRVWIE
jgi:Uma2 family endonuclease